MRIISSKIKQPRSVSEIFFFPSHKHDDFPHPQKLSLCVLRWPFRNLCTSEAKKT